MMRITSLDDEHIRFSDGSMMTYWHDQECCENNWVDFSHAEQTFQDGVEFQDYSVSTADGGFGFILTLIDVDGWKRRRIYLPAYSDQNGYYTNEVNIRIIGKPHVDVLGWGDVV